MTTLQQALLEDIDDEEFDQVAAPFDGRRMWNAQIRRYAVMSSGRRDKFGRAIEHVVCNVEGVLIRVSERVKP